MRTIIIGRMARLCLCIALAGTAVFFSMLSAVPASGATIIIKVDEHGNGFGTSGPGFVGTDSSDLCGSDTEHMSVCTHALIYILPFAPVAGDVNVADSGTPQSPGPILDLIRFNCAGSNCTGKNQANQLVFYSDGTGSTGATGETANDAIADVTTVDGPGGTFYTNTINNPPLFETGSEGNSSVTYTPTAGQPGYNASDPTSYLFVSDGVVPEPSTLALTGSGLLGLAAFSRRRRVVSSHRP